MEWIFVLVPLVFCFAIPLVLMFTGDDSDKIIRIEQKLDKIIELLEKDKGA